jgi:sialate O-acetylesterase
MVLSGFETTISSLKETKAKLILGRIVDADSVLCKRSFAGTTSYMYPKFILLMRKFYHKRGKTKLPCHLIIQAEEVVEKINHTINSR